MAHRGHIDILIYRLVHYSQDNKSEFNFVQSEQVHFILGTKLRVFTTRTIIIHTGYNILFWQTEFNSPLPRGPIGNRTYGTHKYLCVLIFSLTIFGSFFTCPPVILMFGHSQGGGGVYTHASAYKRRCQPFSASPTKAGKLTCVRVTLSARNGLASLRGCGKGRTMTHPVQCAIRCCDSHRARAFRPGPRRVEGLGSPREGPRGRRSEG